MKRRFPALVAPRASSTTSTPKAIMGSPLDLENLITVSTGLFSRAGERLLSSRKNSEKWRGAEIKEAREERKRSTREGNVWPEDEDAERGTLACRGNLNPEMCCELLRQVL